eukprot:SAG11_NODE_134_length_15338_cov_3.876435_27_plen_42_part_00
MQLDWIKKVLTTSEADWKIVMGHFPIYSATVKVLLSLDNFA